jgi:DNA adenine methylase
MKPPVKYFGGKGNQINQILEQFPAPNTYSVYLGPFGGGANILLARPTGWKHVEIYNDIWANVYSLFKVLSDPKLFEEFKGRCDLAIYSSDLRDESREALKRTDLSLVDRAYHYFYANRTSHNGIGGFSKNTCIRRGMSKSISDFLSSIDRLRETHDRLSRVIIENKDALDLLEEYNRPNVFAVCDPPYHQTTRGSTRYAVDFSDEQHERLLDILLKFQGKVLLCGYDNPFYNRLESKFSKINYEVNTVGGDMKPKTKIEYQWRNY